MEENRIVEEESSISLVEIFNIIKKRFWLLVATTLLGGLLVGTYAFFIATPKYISTGAIMVQVKTGSSDNIDTIESQRLIQSTVDILTKIDLVPEETSKVLKENHNLDITKKQIRNNLTVSNASNSLLIQLSYTSEDEANTKLVLEEVINSLKRVTDDEKYNMSKTLKDNISALYVSEAKYHSPNKLLFVFVGLIIGGTLGLTGVFISEMINSGYKTKEEIERDLNIQLLGEIPEFKIQ